MDATDATPELDVNDLGVAVVALLLHERVPADHLGSPHLSTTRSGLEAAVGPELAAWLRPSALDGEQVLYLVDVLRRRGVDDDAFVSSLARAVQQAPDGTNALWLLRNGCRRRRQWGAALQAYGSWRQMARETADLADEACSLHNLGALHEEMGGLDEAVVCQVDRRSPDVALNDRVSAALTLLGIAAVRRGQGRRCDSLTAVLRSLGTASEEPTPGVSAAVWTELGALCEEDGPLDTAGTLHELSQRELDASGGREDAAMALRRLAWVRLLQSRTSEAANHYLTSPVLSPRWDIDVDQSRGAADVHAQQAAGRLAAPLSRLRRSASHSALDAMSIAMPLWRHRIVSTDAVA